MTQKRIAVIGGGITGMSAAYYAFKGAEKGKLEAKVTLFECEPQLGGKISTIRRDGFIIERGPDSFLTRKTPILALSQELGITEQFTGLNPEAKKTYILRKGKLHRIPPGLSMGIPTQFVPFVTTGLISPLAKLRAGFDLVIPRRKADADESLGGFIRRRLGGEVAEYMVEPLLAGIYAGNLDELSVRATFPMYHDMERKHRSLIKGMFMSKSRVKPPAASADAASARPNPYPLPERVKRSMFLSYQQGLSTLVEALDKELNTHIQVLTSHAIVSIERAGDGWLLEDGLGNRYEFDAVIVALPAYAAAKLVHASSEAAQLLSNIRYVSVANAALAFDASQLQQPLDGSGFVIPRKEGTNMTACTWTSEKWKHTAPEGKVLVRCYFGRSGDEGWVDKSDQEITDAALHDLRETMGIHAEPEFIEINRWPRSMPQYHPGHLEMISQIRAVLAQDMPGIYVTGSAFEGVGIPDCIQQGKHAAEQALGMK